MKNRTLNILVVDDDRNFAHTLCAILRSEGYECREVYSVEAAQQLLIREQFDFVLSDVKMEDKSGPDLYYEIKQKFPHLPFILMTAYTSSEVIEKALEAGVLAAFQKPIDIKGILQYFAKLSQSLSGAVVCEDREICALINRILENRRFSFTLFTSVDQLLQSRRADFAIVFIDTHEYCDHFCTKIRAVLDQLSENTIVVICDFKKTVQTEKAFPKKMNLIILPREKKATLEIESILQKQYYLQAKKTIQ